MDRSEVEARGGLPPNIEMLTKPVPFERLQQIAAEVVSSWQMPAAISQ
jgi:hypothetical protein